MKNYTHKTHIRNYYENGRSEPRILVESPTEDGDYIEYTSSLLTSAIMEYEGNIPDSDEIQLNVWHKSKDIQDPNAVIVGEYEDLGSVAPSNNDEISLQEKVKEWAGDDLNPQKYESIKSEFLLSTEEDRESYCTSLLTCSCGERRVCTSVSEAVGYQLKHKYEEDCEYSMIWYLCGIIDKETRRMANSAYEAKRMGLSSIITNFMKDNEEKEPIDTVPIDKTPFSIALKDVGAYQNTEHSLDTPVSEKDL